MTLGAEGQGMVAGDLVNTASRIQSAAEPGTVLVGEATRRATEAAIAYEDAGDARAEGQGGARRSSGGRCASSPDAAAARAAGLEAPFVGRDRELRLVKELFHATADEGKRAARLGRRRRRHRQVAARLGVREVPRRPRRRPSGGTAGRCLAYGEGVAYWALAEMVRMRAPASPRTRTGDTAVAKLAATLEEHVPMRRSGAWVEPRLAASARPRASGRLRDREDLFSAWRLFFERIAEQGPSCSSSRTCSGPTPRCVDFIDYLLEWSRSYPIFVIALARPELAERHPTGAPARAT